MPPTLIVKAEVSVLKRRRLAARRVVSFFEDRLPDLPLLCLLDDEDCGALRGPGMAANRGVYFRKGSALFHRLPAYFAEHAFVGGEPAFGDFVYLHGSTCSEEIGLTITLAHELQIRVVRTRAEAESMAAAAGADTHVFAIHPELGWPDEEWVTADPKFW